MKQKTVIIMALILVVVLGGAYALYQGLSGGTQPNQLATQRGPAQSAQVTAGGVLTENFNPQTLESRLVPGLYACGEVLDVDGDCGGYNLQWAWSSGRCAGLHAGKESV